MRLFSKKSRTCLDQGWLHLRWFRASAWELLLLVEGRRVELDRDVDTWIEASFEGARYREAPLNFEVARAAAKVRLAHRDPADRLLAATALHYELALVTADERLQAGRGFPLLRR